MDCSSVFISVQRIAESFRKHIKRKLCAGGKTGFKKHIFLVKFDRILTDKQFPGGCIRSLPSADMPENILFTRSEFRQTNRGGKTLGRDKY